MFFQSHRRGFTLIEMLVVVLAVVVLIAIAVPQYQRAIRRSRFSTLKSIAKMAKDAQELHYDIHSFYATNDQLSDMDIQLPQNASLDNIST